MNSAIRVTDGGLPAEVNLQEQIIELLEEADG